MPNRFFSKCSPKQALLMSNGAYLAFIPIDPETAALCVSDPAQQAECDLAIRNHRGGLTEISEADFNALLEKKNALANSPPPWREEIGKGAAAQYQAGRQPPPAVAAATVNEPAIPEADPAKGYRPSATKR